VILEVSAHYEMKKSKTRKFCFGFVLFQLIFFSKLDIVQFGDVAIKSFQTSSFIGYLINRPSHWGRYNTCGITHWLIVAYVLSFLEAKVFFGYRDADYDCECGRLLFWSQYPAFCFCRYSWSKHLRENRICFFYLEWYFTGSADLWPLKCFF